MEKFKWDTVYDYGQEFIDWLRANQNKPITLEEYTDKYKNLAVRRKNGHAPSRAKTTYTYLREKFGFFPHIPEVE